MDTTPASLPFPITLEGKYVTVMPLDPAAHFESLYRNAHPESAPQLWRYLFDGPFEDRASFRSHLEGKAASRDPLCFALLSNRSGEAEGYASYMRIEPRHRVIEIGSILLTPPLQRTAASTEAMFLMAKYVFEDLGYRRYEWKCDSRNDPSRRAALRLGFTFEGLFRQHMIVKDESRDTAWFSMLDCEWPQCKQAFEAWLHPENFDSAGLQKSSLSALRAAIASSFSARTDSTAI